MKIEQRMHVANEFLRKSPSHSFLLDKQMLRK
jgi:hypothetical protein